MKTKLPAVKEVNEKDIVKKVDSEGNIVGYLVMQFDAFQDEIERANIRREVIS